MDILLLRLDAPIMSFGAPIVDRFGVIQPYPALSMMTGLLANALGYDHSDFQKLQELQDRIVYAVRQDRAGEKIQDYQTVDLSQNFMQDENAWTTQHRLDERKGGSASEETHIRLRDYWADASYTIALTMKPADGKPAMDDLEKTLKNPERPLFIGRKSCLPATSIFLERCSRRNLIEALKKIAPSNQRGEERDKYKVWWPVDENHEDLIADIELPVTDQRDWSNQIHAGERWIAKGEIKLQIGGNSNES